MSKLHFDTIPTCKPSGSSAPEWLFKDFLEQGQMAVVNAVPGSGLTWFLMALMDAATSSNAFLDEFQTETICNALYMNAGMELDAIQSRLARMLSKDQQDRVKILSTNEIFKQQDEVFFDLSDREYRDIVQLGLESNEEYKLLVIDTFDGFFPKYKAKESAIGKWFLELKQAGVSIVVGVSSSSKVKNELVDLELGLESLVRGDNLTLKVDFLKARNLPLSKRKPFMVEMAEKENRVKMRYLEFKQGTMERVAYLTSEGLTQSQVARRLDLSQSTVSRRLSQAMQAGIIEMKGRYFTLTDDGKNLIKGQVEDLSSD